jgi:hypothetical protein
VHWLERTTIRRCVARTAENVNVRSKSIGATGRGTSAGKASAALMSARWYQGEQDADPFNATDCTPPERTRRSSSAWRSCRRSGRRRRCSEAAAQHMMAEN